MVEYDETKGAEIPNGYLSLQADGFRLSMKIMTGEFTLRLTLLQKVLADLLAKSEKKKEAFMKNIPVFLVKSRQKGGE